MGRALNRRATRAAHFNGVVQLALGVDRFRGALELPETWEIVGPRIDMSTSTTKTSFLLGNWAALLGVVDGNFGPRKWPSVEEMEKFDKI